MDTRGEIIIYQTEDGLTKINVNMQDETVWLSKAQMAELFQRDRSVISKHIKKVFEEGELSRESNVQILHVANSDKPVEFYNLDVIISVGYRVKSQRGVQFRIWATSVLKEYMIKGFAMDDERLKGNGGGNYWKELLDRIRDIRSSEKVLYRQVLDLYATSVDYNPHSEESIRFFKIVQNKLVEVDGKEYKNIIGDFDFWGLWKQDYHKTFTATEKQPLSLNLPKGNYTFTITDSLETDKKVSKPIKIRENNENTNITIISNFGKLQSEETVNGDYDADDVLTGAVEFNGHWYKIIEDSSVTNWNAAKQYCNNLNGYLATINSQAENDFLYNYIINDRL